MKPRPCMMHHIPSKVARFPKENPVWCTIKCAALSAVRLGGYQWCEDCKDYITHGGCEHPAKEGE